MEACSPAFPLIFQIRIGFGGTKYDDWHILNLLKVHNDVDAYTVVLYNYLMIIVFKYVL